MMKAGVKVPAMSVQRPLPERRNPLVQASHSPSHEILVDRRRLGQTNLSVKPAIPGVSHASRAENLGTFDYAHLRVPLPKDLSGSGVFNLKSATAYPESYFLMRRSSDGHVSATGMFKAAFPWASAIEEESERRHQKTYPSAGPDEVAGSVWIAPAEALELADEYGLRLWVEALLDPTPIEKGTNKDKHATNIQQPPKFDIKQYTPPVALPPSSALRSTRARSSRSASPSKIATPSRKMASPRKSRTTRSSTKPESTKLEDVFDVKASSATSALQNVVENGTTASESAASESVNGEAKEEAKEEPKSDDSVRIEVQETVEQNGDVESTTTNVKIDVPADHPELPQPEDPTDMIAEAKKMVEEAHKLEGGAEKTVKAGKRKAEKLLDEDEDRNAGPSEQRPAKAAKTAYTTEQKLTKEKVTRRALVGLGVMTAIGAAFQYLA